MRAHARRASPSRSTPRRRPCRSSSAGRTHRPCWCCRSRTCSPGSSRSAAVRTGVRLGHTSDVSRLVADVGGFRPTFLLAVPRVFERLFTTASQAAVIDGRGGMFDRAAQTAISWSRSLDTGRVSPAAPRPAPLLRPPRVRRAAGRARGSLRVRDLRRGAARRAPGPLLPRHRRPRARGVRAHRDDGRGHGQRPWHNDRDRRPPLAGHGPGRRRRRAAGARGPGDRGLLGGPGRRPPRRWTEPAGWRPATSARSTTRASSRSPAARRRCW